MKKKSILFLLLCIFLISCNDGSKTKVKDGVAIEYYSDGTIQSETEVKDTLAHGLMKKYDRDGNLLSVYTFNMGKLNGPAVTYYTNGQLEQKMYYKDGRRQGTSQWFYSTGELYRVIPYAEGKIDGIKITYYRNGKIMAEAPYKNGLPGIGLKEYNSEGVLIKDDTKIVITEDNRLFAENQFILKISLSKSKPGSDFYLGDLEDGKYIGLYQWQLPVTDGVSKYIITLPKGGFRMETLQFSATYKTSKSNIRVLSRTYNLAIDNK